MVRNVAIYLTGDVHGGADIAKVLEFDSVGLTRNDYLIILGDFGCVWFPEETGDSAYAEARKEHEALLEWLDSCPYTTLWIDGNHENFDLLEALPVDEWHGGCVHHVREHVIHLMRSHIFEIDGRTFFAMGGAPSLDKGNRKPGQSWWPQELPNAEERMAAEQVLAARNWNVDYVLTHAAPSPVLREIDPDWPYILMPDEYTDWLQSLAERLAFKRWFYGHYHVDRWWDSCFTGFFNEIFDLDDTGRSPLGPSTDIFDVE